MSPTFVWADDTHLLTLRGDGNIVIAHDKGRVNKPLVTIPDVEDSGCGPELDRDAGGQIYYREKFNEWPHRRWQTHL